MAKWTRHTDEMRNLALTFFALLAVGARGQTAADVDRAALRHLETTKTPGVSIGIYVGGQPILEKAYGLANIETDAQAQPETIYRIGSLTKVFTSTLILQLMEEGKLKLDDPASKYLPELPKPFEKVTIRQLLSHTSGTKNYTEQVSPLSGMREATTPKKIIELAAKEPLDFAPGTKWSYSNTGYVILGEIVAKLDGKPWANALDDRIAKPLGLESTRASSLGKITKGRAAGYGLGPVNAVFMDLSWASSAGMMESTVGDLGQFIDKVGTKLLKPETFALATTPAPSSPGYGLGWGIRDIGGRKLLFHGGGINGFSSEFLNLPDKKLTIVVLTNSDAGNPEPLAMELLRLSDPTLKLEIKATQDDNPELTAFLRGKFERLLKGELTSDELTPTFAEKLTPELVSDIHKTLGAAGSLERFELASANGPTRSYIVVIGGQTLTAAFTLTPEKKIAGLLLKG